MIKYANKIFLVLSLLIIGGVTAQAQIEPDTTIDANIPFQFVAGNKTLPAGKYVIRQVDDTENSPNSILIRSADGKTTAVFNTTNAGQTNPAKQSEIIFDNVGGTYFLSQIFAEGENGGLQAVESKKEKKMKAGGNTVAKQSVVCTKRKSSEQASQ